jgi:hypothetical protein
MDEAIKETGVVPMGRRNLQMGDPDSYGGGCEIGARTSHRFGAGGQ